ncbi:MAG TPA: NAD(P)/FAD-dependent oxidoreductase, partial [Thermoanaerobaculia bacterium]|nr:NAD(P)/FAD-dependent oxidoreductase [Thermoanaerobaculia bacterium]
ANPPRHRGATILPEMTEPETLHVVGAGPAGLTAAIVARRAGRPVVVHERRRDVGSRFHGDFQGLENWSTESDVLDELGALGIEPTFEAIPFRQQVCFGPDGREHVFRTASPFYYLVRRGPEPGTLDHALKQQALAAGAEIRFGETVRHPFGGGVAAWGPRRADVLAVGYLFETDLADGSFAVLDDRLAPKGYAYLLVAGGRATLATCMFRDFHREDEYLERTLDFFRRRVGFTMRRARRFGGVGTTRPPRAEALAHVAWAGEAAGLLDALWGFGIRYALRSAQLAALGSSRQLWETAIGRPLRASFVNRFFYERAGTAAYRWLLWRLTHTRDPRRYLRRAYHPSPWKRALFPLVRSAFGHGEEPRPECSCTWCQERT